MSKHGFLVLMMTGLCMNLMAAKEIDFQTLDRETYRLYQEEKWDSLVDLGKAGIKQGFDYYYLRYRMGVAYYSMKNYIKAKLHFGKAYEFNQNDNALLTYLYYTNLYLNRDKQARNFAQKIPEARRKELQIDDDLGFVDKIYLEGGILFGNDDKNNGDLQKQWTDSTIYLENQLTGNSIYSHAGLKMNLSPDISLYSGMSYIQRRKKNKYRYYTDLALDSIVETTFTSDYYYTLQQEEMTFRSNIRQIQLYLKADFYLGKDWNIAAYGHYLRVNYKKFDVNYIPHEEKEIEYYDKFNGTYNYFDYIRNEYIFNQKDTVLNDYIIGLSTNKNFQCLGVSAAASFSSLNLRDQLGFSAGVHYYPFGNLNLYGATSFSYYIIENHQENKFLFSQSVSLKILPRTWLEGKYMQGELENTYWDQSFVVYNVYDKIKYIAELNLLMLLTEKLELSIRYQYREKEGWLLHYYNDFVQRPNDNTINTNYTEQMIIGGLTWKM